MKTIRFFVATDPALYGPDATPQDAQEYAAFAHQHLQKESHDPVEIEFVERYPAGSADMQADLRSRVWSAYLNR
jgi:hypothetical protein